MKHLLSQLYYALYFAIQSVVINKVRTLLSLLGITIGIFAIISVFTVLDTLEQSIRDNVNKIGTNIVYVGRWPWGPIEEGHEGQEYEWWKYAARPIPQFNEGEELGQSVSLSDSWAVATTFNRTLSIDKRSKENALVFAATHDYNLMRDSEIGNGRYFSPHESRTGSPVVILGAITAQELFDTENPIGKTIKIGNVPTEVIGVFEKQGTNMFGISFDEQALVPYAFARNFVNLLYREKDLMIKGKEGVHIKDLKAETTAAMRRIRRLPPGTENNFTANEVTGALKPLDTLFAMINLAGGVIGFFSILVGGFGIANIMFVSVRERTAQIGIRKALGAKPYSILLQFTIEAVLLALVGGIVGLALIWFGAGIVSLVSEYTVVLTVKNIMIGIILSSVIGAVSGIIPAWMAAKMDPVKAITKG